MKNELKALSATWRAWTERGRPPVGARFQELVWAIEKVLEAAPPPAGRDTSALADRELDEDELRERYEKLQEQDPEWRHHDKWPEHPKYPEKDWQFEVSNGDTRQGYWAWVVTRLEHEEEGQ